MLVAGEDLISKQQEISSTSYWVVKKYKYQRCHSHYIAIDSKPDLTTLPSKSKAQFYLSKDGDT